MYFNTGLEWDQIVDLCIRITALDVSDDKKIGLHR
jgi:hypothetical protein